MPEELIGWPFVLLIAPIMVIAVMAIWYRFRPAAESARGLSALTVLLIAPLAALFTVEWRWGEVGDHPASGLPGFAAVYEIFGIWCVSMILVFLLHSPMQKFFRKWHDKDIVDPETFE